MWFSLMGLIQVGDSLSTGNNSDSGYQQELALAFILGLLPVILSFSFIIFVIYRSRINQEFKQKETDLRLAKAESELKALRAQINPHFIFNCLNSIQHFIQTQDSALASEYLIKFSKLIRYVLESSVKSWVSLEDELEANRIYLELERLRKNQTFHFQIELDPSLSADRIFIPPMFIQPFLENSVWHGVKDEGGIRISFAKEDRDHLICRIFDQGNGSVERPKYDLINHVKKSSMGINLMEERFRTLNELRGKKCGFTFQDLSTGGKVVKISLPFEEDDE